MNRSIEIGVIGISVMGQGVAQNLARNGVSVSVYNRSYARTEAFMNKVSENNITPYRDIETFVKSLKRPRKICMLVKAGDPTDAVIDMISPLLDEGDILMDMGNSFYLDTERREASLRKAGILFLGVGISGGEKGALEGPSIMAGGAFEAWESVSSVLKTIAAKTADGTPCCEYFGIGGSGHFIKMVHNSIEYAYMGVISELYQVMRDAYGFTVPETAKVFNEFISDSTVSSYLIEITADILQVEDGDGWIIDKIQDTAGNKGTGRWTSETALRLGVAVPTLTQALYARYLSERKHPICDRLLKKSTGYNELNVLRDCLRFSQYICFEQGLNLILCAKEKYNWNLNPVDVLNVWRGGCIIRTAYIPVMSKAFQSECNVVSLFEDETICAILRECSESAGKVIIEATKSAIPVPCIGSSLAYYDTLCSERLPTVMIQAQRDFFGAHTYRRIDKNGMFHTEWENGGREIRCDTESR